MELNFNSTLEEYYKNFIDLQDKLKRSEEQRFQLELKFNELVHMAKEEEQAHYKKLRSQYKKFLEEDRKRQERNEQIIRNLERVETKISMLSAKTERIDMLRKQYQNYLIRVSFNQNNNNEADTEFEPPKLSRSSTWLKPHAPKRNSKISASDSCILNKSKTKTFYTTDEFTRSSQSHLSSRLTSDHQFRSQHNELADDWQNNKYHHDHEEKFEFLNRFLENLSSERCRKLLNQERDSQDKLLMLNRLESDLVPSNQAAAIADDILDSIYSRYYNKDTFRNERTGDEAFESTAQLNEIDKKLNGKRTDRNIGEDEVETPAIVKDIITPKTNDKKEDNKDMNLLEQTTEILSNENDRNEEVEVPGTANAIVKDLDITPAEAENDNNLIAVENSLDIKNDTGNGHVMESPIGSVKITGENTSSNAIIMNDDKNNVLLDIKKEEIELVKNQQDDNNRNIGEGAVEIRTIDINDPLPVSNDFEYGEAQISDEPEPVSFETVNIPEQVGNEQIAGDNDETIEEQQVVEHIPNEERDLQKESVSNQNNIAFDYPDQMISDNGKQELEINQTVSQPSNETIAVYNNESYEPSNFNQSQYEQQQYVDNVSVNDNNQDGYNQYGEYGEQIFYNQNGEICQPAYDENGEMIPQYNDNGEIIVLYDQNGQQYFGDQLQYDQMQQYDENGQPIYSQHDFNYGINENQYGNNDTGEIPLQQYIDENQDIVNKQLPNKDQDNVNSVQEQINEKSENQVEMSIDHQPIENAGKTDGNILDMLDTDTESTKENTSKIISNDSDFDFS